MEHRCSKRLVLEIEVDHLVGHVNQLRNILVIPLVKEILCIVGHDVAVVCKMSFLEIFRKCRRNNCCVQIAVDQLADPVFAANIAESLIEIRAGGAPPAADAEIHR